MKISAIIFDLNGTLIEIFKKSEYKNDFLRQTAEILNVDYDTFDNAWFDSRKFHPWGDYPSVETRVEMMLKEYFGKTPEEIHAMGDKITKSAEIRKWYIFRQLTLIQPHVIEFLEWVKTKGYKMGMVSNSTMETPLQWKNTKLSKYFPNPSFSSDLHINKPDVKIFHNEFEKLGINNPKEVIYIADGDDNELNAAEKIGMIPILLKYDIEDAFRHKGFPQCDIEITDFNQLPKIIEELELQNS